MGILLSFVAGLVLAGVVAIVVLRSVKSAAAEAQAKALEDAAMQADANQRAAVAALEADLRNAQSNLEQSKIDADKHTQELLDAQEKAHTEAMSAMEKRHTEAIDAEHKRYEQALETMKEQVENATSKMLKDRQEELQKSNSTNMKQIVDPLNETIKKMEDALKENKSTQETSTEAIKEKIATLVSTTMQVSTSAERLSNALTSKAKAQGNWGEQKIEALLNAIGLNRGLEYDAQEYLREDGSTVVSDESNSRLQPDIILHLDGTRDLIIDSKVSLTAFIDYTNAEDDEVRDLALKSHLDSVRKHVNELAKKNYSAYVKSPRQSVDFVMMFVPVDAALQLALSSDQTLWRDAMNKGVFIVGEQNLYAALHAVKVTWTAIKQNANNKAICDTAAELLNRVGDLLERVKKMGNKLDEVHSAYDDVLDKAIKGRQTVLGSANKLVKLGAKASPVHPLTQFGDDEDEPIQQLPPAE